MAKYSINHIERKIVLTKKFANDAKKLDSDSYRILKQLRLDNPGYELTMRTIKNKNPKSACRNLNYERIRRYIIAREGAGSAIEAQFDVVIGLAKKEKGPYAYVKKWFIKQYPDADVFTAPATNQN